MMLAKAAGLDDKGTGVKGAQVNQMDHRTPIFQLLDQRCNIKGQTRAAAIGVEIAHATDQETTIVDDLGRAKSQLDQRLGDDRVMFLPMVNVDPAQIGLIFGDQRHSTAD